MLIACLFCKSFLYPQPKVCTEQATLSVWTFQLFKIPWHVEDTSNPGNWPGQALNTAHFQYQPLSCFLKQDAFVYIVIVYLFYNKNAYQKKKNPKKTNKKKATKKNPTLPYFFGQFHEYFFQRHNNMIAIGKKKRKWHKI